MPRFRETKSAKEDWKTSLQAAQILRRKKVFHPQPTVKMNYLFGSKNILGIIKGFIRDTKCAVAIVVQLNRRTSALEIKQTEFFSVAFV